MSIEEFLGELEKSYEGVEAGAFKADTEFRALPFWDSLSVLTLLSVVDGCLGTQLSPSQLRACRTLGEVYRAASQ